VWYLVVAYLVYGAGAGLVSAPITNTALSGMPRDQAGVAGAIASTFRQAGVLPATLDEDGTDALDGHHDAGTTNDRNDRSAVLGCCAGGGRWATRAGTGAQ